MNKGKAIIISNEDSADNIIEITGELISNIIIEAEIVSAGPRGLKGDSLSLDDLTDEQLDQLGSMTIVPAENIIESNSRVFVTEEERVKLLTGYVHKQIVASKTWIIPHPLHKYPSVTIVDTAGSVMLCDITYVSLDEVIANASAPFSGEAYLN